MRLTDKVCIITGGGSGIGRAAALLFALEGAQVVVADINVASAEHTAADVVQQGGQAVALEVDVSQSASVAKMVQWTAEELGRIDVLVNNAGYGLAATVVQTEEADWDRLMGVNLKGVYFGCKHTIPVMRSQGGGVIVNTASAAGVVGVRDRAAYCASKGGVIALTRAMALDHVSEGIRINCVAPGSVHSPYFDEIYAKSENPLALKKELVERHPVKHLGKPEEIAQGMLYLASDDSSFTTVRC